MASDPMVTELVDVPIVPTGGRQIKVNARAVQNRRLLPLAAFIADTAIWMIESESNNVGSALDPTDVKNVQKFKNSMLRIWDRTKRFNRGGGNTSLEVTHPTAFPDLSELQSMANTPMKQLAYVLWDTYNTMLQHQGSKLQVFIDADAIDAIDSRLEELVDYVDVEFGTGEPTSDGKFNTGAGMPNLSRVGRVTPSPMGGSVSVSEPSSATPPTTPGDQPDVA